MLTVHFLNVGHGECTLIEHPSGRLTMVDINTSHEYDWNTRQEIAADSSQGLAAAGNPGLLGGVAPSGNLPTGLSALLDSNPSPTILGGVGLGNPVRGLAGLLGPTPTLLKEGAADAAAKSELADPVKFLQSRYPNRSLFRLILTHPDLDHMRGLKRMRETVGFTNFWDIQHTKETPIFRGENDRDEWSHYQQLRSGAFGLKPKFFTRGDEYFAFARGENGLGNGDGIEILSPSSYLVASCNAAKKSNDLSYVVRVRHANRTVLLTGDIEAEAWTDLQATYRGSLKTDYLQASHHGRDSGFHESSLKLIAPRVVIVSVGRKPSTDAHSKYKAVCNQVWSTRYYGNIKLVIYDDGNHQWFVDRNADT